MPGGQVGAVCGEKTGDFSMVAEEFRAINRLRGGSLPVNHRLIWGYGVFIFPILVRLVLEMVVSGWIWPGTYDGAKVFLEKATT
jgi:hypothetical protein